MSSGPGAAAVGGRALVDCTQLIDENTFGFCGCLFSREVLFDSRSETRLGPEGEENGGYLKQKYVMGCDVGTHIDAPLHFVPQGRAIHELRLDELTAPGVVVDVTAQVAQNADYEMSREDLLGFEKEHGKIPDGALVVMKTGWGKRFASASGENDGGEYLNKSADGKCHFPGFHVDAARFLVKERNIVGIGIDTPSLDNGLSTTFPVHIVVLGADKYQIENMNLESVPGGNCSFVSLPLNVKGGPEAEARVMAILK